MCMLENSFKLLQLDSELQANATLLDKQSFLKQSKLDEVEQSTLCLCLQ